MVTIRIFIYVKGKSQEGGKISLPGIPDVGDRIVTILNMRGKQASDIFWRVTAREWGQLSILFP